ncbi:MAG: SRPBCC domain-containing protein [Thermoleophilaceae bacterium]
MTTIQAAGRVQAPRASVFEFLSNLDNHWLLADRFVEVVSLDGGSGGRVRVRGPAGISRVADTTIDSVDPPHTISGTARVGEETTAGVSWQLEDDGDDGTHVRITATVLEASPGDRLLLTLGGQAWLERSFGRILDALEEQLSRGASPQGPPSADAR